MRSGLEGERVSVVGLESSQEALHQCLVPTLRLGEEGPAQEYGDSEPFSGAQRASALASPTPGGMAHHSPCPVWPMLAF